MRVMVIGAGWEQERLIRLAKERGHWVLATAWPSTYADSLELADKGEIVDPKELMQIWRLAEDNSIEAVVSDQCDYSYYASAYIADRMGLPGPGLSAARIAIDKYMQRESLKGSGVLQPKYRLCTEIDELWAAIREIGYPAIVKPVDNRGNFGVNRVDDSDQARAAFYEAMANTLSRRILVEEFIEGTMTTVEGFMYPDGKHASLATSSKVMLGGYKRVAMELQYPADYDSEIIDGMIESNEMAIKALGYRFGPTHAEYMVDADGRPYFIEAANRGGGVLINSHIVPALTGIDTSEIMLDFATGRSTPRRESVEADGFVTLSFFGLSAKGKVKGFKGIDEARAIPGVIATRMMVKVGDSISPITTDAGRHGFVIAKSDNREGVVSVVNDVKRMIEVECV